MPNALRLRALAALSVLATALLAGAATAQIPPPQVALALEEDARAVEANGTASVRATVTYEDAVPGSTGTVTLAVAAPEGWVVVIEPSPTFTLEAGGSRTVTLTVTAPPAGSGAGAGDALVSASVTAGAARPAGTASATLALSRTDPAPVPPPDLTPLLLAGGLAALLAAGGGAAVARRRRLDREAAARAAWLARETGITLTQAGEPAPFGDRRETAVRLAVRNASDRPRVALVDVRAAPPGWLASLNVPRRELKPGEEMVVTLTVRPPPGEPIGSRARVVVSARPEEARERDERVTLDVPAGDPRAGDGTAPRWGQRAPRPLRR